MSGKEESIASFESTVRKLESAHAKMAGQGSNTTLVAKRLEANRVGLAALKHAWFGQDLAYGRDELTAARDVLHKLLPSLHRQYEKFASGSPQKTVTQRRIRALEQAIQVLDERLGS